MSTAQAITAALGGRWTGGHGMACCPAHEDRQPSLSLADGADGRLLVKCHAGCTYDAIRAALSERGLSSGGGPRSLGGLVRDLVAEARAREQARRSSAQAQDIWTGARPITGTLAETYLRSRGITGPLPDTLRFRPHCWHASAKRLPALISRIDGAEGFAVHRTYLDAATAGKAELTPNKAMLGPARGGAVRLSGDGPLLITEGIETALSLVSGLIREPVRLWAALSAGGMRNLRLPETPGQMIIASDGDPVGLDAGEALAERAFGLGWQVSLLPAPTGSDWNDVLTGKAQAA